MNHRERFIDYVKHGGKPICSPQIGAGAGFDSKILGHEWLHHTSFDDTLKVVGMFDIVPLLNAGAPDLSLGNQSLQWRTVKHEETPGRICSESVLETPVGTLSQKVTHEKLKGSYRNECPVKTGDDLPALEYYIDAVLDNDFSPVTDLVRDMVEKIGGRAALDIQWPVQPYELLCFPDTVTTVMLHLDYPETCKRLMDKILELDAKLMDAVAKGGADFIFLGGPAAEMISPSFYEDFIIPYSQQASAAAHERGLLVYSHICSPIEPFLTMGFYNRMGIDLFETLSPPPVGNVASLADALTKIDPTICTRGNLGLDVLLNEDPETIKEKTFEILRDTEGRKHMVAASDYLFYDTPVENVHAMAEAVREYNGCPSS